MNGESSALSAAWQLISNLDSSLTEIVALSLRVSLTAVALSAAIGLPAGALIAVTRFPGRSVVVVTLNALMGLPPVVAGLAIYLLLSRSGPLGPLGLLFTPAGMVIAQMVFSDHCCAVAPDDGRSLGGTWRPDPP